VGFLSGGEQQMLALGRALAANPRVLLLDEVSMGLAPIVVDGLMEAVARAATEGAAVLLVEQRARRALSVAHRGYFMSHGRITTSGSSAELTEYLSVSHDAYFGAAATTSRSRGVHQDST
jgi:branched-chain amino acid transport system ATP-binding protein